MYIHLVNSAPLHLLACLAGDGKMIEGKTREKSPWGYSYGVMTGGGGDLRNY